MARSVSETAGGWVAPEQIAALTAPGAAGGYQMLYRFTAADTAAQVDAGRAAVQASVPAGALTGTTVLAHHQNRTAPAAPCCSCRS